MGYLDYLALSKLQKTRVVFPYSCAISRQVQIIEVNSVHDYAVMAHWSESLVRGFQLSYSIHAMGILLSFFLFPPPLLVDVPFFFFLKKWKHP